MMIQYAWSTFKYSYQFCHVEYSIDIKFNNVNFI